jgi:hypothetical protein
MKRWTEIVELMDTDIAVKQSRIRKKIPGIKPFETKFKVNGMKFVFVASPVGGGRGNNLSDQIQMEIVFYRVSPDNSRGTLVADQYDVLNDLNMKQTLAVFSGVKKSLNLYIKNNPGIDFFFTSKSIDATRTKLYDRFAKNIASGYKLNLDRQISGGVIIYSFQHSS